WSTSEWHAEGGSARPSTRASPNATRTFISAVDSGSAPLRGVVADVLGATRSDAQPTHPDGAIPRSRSARRMRLRRVTRLGQDAGGPAEVLDLLAHAVDLAAGRRGVEHVAQNLGRRRGLRRLI